MLGGTPGVSQGRQPLLGPLTDYDEQAPLTLVWPSFETSGHALPQRSKAPEGGVSLQRQGDMAAPKVAPPSAQHLQPASSWLSKWLWQGSEDEACKSPETPEHLHAVPSERPERQPPNTVPAFAPTLLQPRHQQPVKLPVPLRSVNGQLREGHVRRKHARKVTRYIEMVAEMTEGQSPKFAQSLRTMEPVLTLSADALCLAAQLYMKLYRFAFDVYSHLPHDQLQAVVGLTLCFFGGAYVVLIAAVEAFRTMGGARLQGELQYVVDQVAIVLDANEQDDLRDDDKDGVADVDQIDAKELSRRKLRLVMISIEDPKRLEAATGCLWAACLAVLATLKLEFAQTVAYALAFSDMVKFPVVRCMAPLLSSILGSDLLHWAETIIGSLLKAACILAVWFLAKARAAFYSGLRGGKLFGEAAVRILEAHGLAERMPGWLVKKPFDPDRSYLDEAIGYSAAALGFYFQLSHGFIFLPFPLDWILWPCTLLEEFLELQVSWGYSELQ